MSYYFDEQAADDGLYFFQNYCRHIKGKLAGQPLILEPWGRDIVRDVFGWKRSADGLRRFRIVYLEIPKKNGKSTKAAAFGNKMLFADRELGAEVYSAASGTKQAKIVFDVAAQMVKRDPFLGERAIVYKDSILVGKSSSTYKVLSSAADAEDGINASCVIFDELHRQKDRRLYDVLSGSVAAREQPLQIYITTAGEDSMSICGEMHDRALRVISDPDGDPTFYAKIFAAAKDDDWKDPKVWAKANPNLGVSLTEEFLAQQCAEAMRSPAASLRFRRLHLNQWLRGKKKWLSMEEWGANNAELPDLAGRECFGGLDLSSVRDLTALVLVFPPLYHGEPWWMLWRPFVPADQMFDRAKDDDVPYPKWTEDGHLTATPGNVVDYEAIRKQIAEDGQKYRIREIAYDRWNATHLVSRLTDDGFDMVPFGQGFASFQAPVKEFERLLASREVGHGSHPVASWCADNVTVETDAAGNKKPDKARSQERIDLIVAGLMALGRGITYHEAEAVPSVVVI